MRIHRLRCCGPNVERACATLAFCCAVEDFWLDAVDQVINSGEFSRTLREFMTDNCSTFIDVKFGEHALHQHEVHKVYACMCLYMCVLVRVRVRVRGRGRGRACMRACADGVRAGVL